MAEVKVRPLTQTDIPAVAEVVVIAWQVAYRRILPDTLLDNLSIAQVERHWAERIEEPDKTTFVAEFDHRVVGFVRSGPSRDNDDDPGQVGEVYAIYVHPDYWGRRAGRALLQTATRHLQQQGFSELTLWTLHDNWPARAFYEKAGLATDGATKQTERGGQMSVEVRYRRWL